MNRGTVFGPILKRVPQVRVAYDVHLEDPPYEEQPSLAVRSDGGRDTVSLSDLPVDNFSCYTGIRAIIASPDSH